MIGGGVVDRFDEGFEPDGHVVRVHRDSECRTPLVVALDDGNPYMSVCFLAKQQNSAVWHISLESSNNEQNALDYIDVGIHNGDWVYLTCIELASKELLRKIGIALMTLQPNPVECPRRSLFRLWLVTEKHFDINSTINPLLPHVLAQNALFAKKATPAGYGGSPVKRHKVVKRGAQEPPLLAEEVKKHDARKQIGLDSDEESEHEDPAAKVTGLWFHRDVDFSSDKGQSANKASDDIFRAVDEEDRQLIAAISASGNVDINKVKRNGMNPLMYAVSLEKVGAVQQLLEDGADPNIRRESDGCPMLFMSIDDERIIQLLHDHNADFTAKFEGYRILEHPFTAPNIIAYIKENMDKLE
jgi:hypothetical protein